MRAYQVFAGMDPERAIEVLNTLREASPAVYTQAVAAASVAMKARPQFLMKQPPDKRAQLVRRALARVAASDLAEEVLAAYFLEARRELLVEWLDAVGVDHEEGALKVEQPECPPREKLDVAVSTFLSGDNVADRELLLRAFAAQGAIDWPDLEANFAENAS
jgi:hypothetical protein